MDVNIDSAAAAESNGGNGIRALLSELQGALPPPTSITAPEALVGATSTAAGLAAPVPAQILNAGGSSIGGLRASAAAAAAEATPTEPREGEEEGEEHPFLASLRRQVAEAEASTLASAAGDARKLAAAAEGRALLRRLAEQTTARSRSGCSGKDLLTVEFLSVRESTFSSPSPSKQKGRGRRRHRQTEWRLEAKVSSSPLSSSAADSPVVDLSRARLIVAPSSGGGTEARALTAATRVKKRIANESKAGHASSSSSVLLSATVLFASEPHSDPSDDAPLSLWVWVTAPLLEEKEGGGGGGGGRGGAGAACVAVVAAGRAELRRSYEPAAAGAGGIGRPPAFASSQSSDPGSEDEDEGEREEEEEEEEEEREEEAEQAEAEAEGGRNRNGSGLREMKRSLASSARRLAAAASALAGEVDAATLAMERALLLARGSRSGNGNGNANESDGENATAATIKAWHAASDAAALTDATVEEALR
jgi:hypothetical protein